MLGRTRLRYGVVVVMVVVEVVEVELGTKGGQGLPLRQQFAELRVKLLQAKVRH
jgi:hypothetical protein